MNDAYELGPPRWLIVWLVIVSVLVAGACFFVVVWTHDSRNIEDQNSAILRTIDASEQQRDAMSKKTTIALAVILEDLATVSATPPAPDPARLQAVQSLCDTAAAFRASVGDDRPPVCPAS